MNRCLAMLVVCAATVPGFSARVERIENHPWFRTDGAFVASSQARKAIGELDSTDQDEIRHVLSLLSDAATRCAELAQTLSVDLEAAEVLTPSVVERICTKWFRGSRELDRALLADLKLILDPDDSAHVVAAYQRHSFAKARMLLGNPTAVVDPYKYMSVVASMCPRLMEDRSDDRWMGLSEAFLESSASPFILNSPDVADDVWAAANDRFLVSRSAFTDSLASQLLAFADRLEADGCSGARQQLMCLRYPGVCGTSAVDAVIGLLGRYDLLSDTDRETLVDITSSYAAQREALTLSLLQAQQRWDSGPARRIREQKMADRREKGESWADLLTSHPGLPALRGLYDLESATMGRLRELMRPYRDDLSPALVFAIGLDI